MGAKLEIHDTQKLELMKQRYHELIQAKNKENR
jgi:hypothetical protein